MHFFGNMGGNQIKGKIASSPSSVERSGSETCMNIDSYQFWFDALRSNKKDTVTAILDESDKEETNRLLNGWFHYEDDEHTGLHEIVEDSKRGNVRATRPFILTVLYGSYDVLRCLLDRGADPYCLEEGANNIFHVMGQMTYLFPKYEEYQVKSYIQCISILGKERMSLLLSSENSESLRPLELAAKLGCCKMVKAMLETPGVYLTKEKTRGMVHYQWIDVTEYETTDPKLDRRGKSPLGYLALMTETTLMKPGTMELFCWPPFQMWMKSKFHSNRIILSLWFILRFIQVVMYFVVSADKSLLGVIGGVAEVELTSNVTRNYTFVFCSSYVQYSLAPQLRTFLYLWIAVQAYFTIVFDIAEFIVIRVRKTPKYLHSACNVGSNYVVTKYLYQFNHFCFSAIMALGVTLQFAKLQSVFTPELIQFINLVCTINITFCFMFFFQMLPIVGVYVTTVRRMLRDLLNFSFLYLLWVTPFSLYFLVFFNTNSKFDCVSEFSNIGEAFYSTFRMMLNMLDLHLYEVHTPQVLDLVHVIYVFTVAILLINFLIAVMSTSAARIAMSDKIIVGLERMYVALILESRLGRPLRGLLKRCKERTLVISNSRYYLLNIEYK